jgi:hypothetical protein
MSRMPLFFNEILKNPIPVSLTFLNFEIIIWGCFLPFSHILGILSLEVMKKGQELTKNDDSVAENDDSNRGL